MGQLDGKVAIVTGGNRGIGKGIAKGFAAEGASLTIAARDAELLSQTANELRAMNVKVLAVPTDVTDEEQIKVLFEKAMAEYERLDILVNNAGAFDGGPIDELSTEAWDKVIGVNLRAPFLCSREAMRIMKAQGEGGRIINVGSISAHRVRPRSAPYSASKFGIWGLTQVIALEGRPHGITASCLQPGNTYVERIQNHPFPPSEPMMEVDELAKAAVLMATLPPNINMLEATVLPVGQLYVGRG
ncbi:MAG: SDR family NAD(P)-dependent oxidoreductase [Candidatus Poribacteria bacterium]|nr:SDR family NAD(P)-dependent oxidoreductase [Candidatus Poribacteria bacterium]